MYPDPFFLEAPRPCDAESFARGDLPQGSEVYYPARTGVSNRGFDGSQAPVNARPEGLTKPRRGALTCRTFGATLGP